MLFSPVIIIVIFFNHHLDGGIAIHHVYLLTSKRQFRFGRLITILDLLFSTYLSSLDLPHPLSPREDDELYRTRLFSLQGASNTQDSE